MNASATSTTSVNSQRNNHHRSSASIESNTKSEHSQDESAVTQKSRIPLNGTVNAITQPVNGEHPEAPAAKRRKIIEPSNTSKSSPRAVSPPWRSFHADGPTAFLDNGKRRSGRTNAVPLELQPLSGKGKPALSTIKLPTRKRKGRRTMRVAGPDQ